MPTFYLKMSSIFGVQFSSIKERHLPQIPCVKRWVRINLEPWLLKPPAVWWCKWHLRPNVLCSGRRTHRKAVMWQEWNGKSFHSLQETWTILQLFITRNNPESISNHVSSWQSIRKNEYIFCLEINIVNKPNKIINALIRHMVNSLFSCKLSGTQVTFMKIKSEVNNRISMQLFTCIGPNKYWARKYSVILFFYWVRNRSFVVVVVSYYYY